MMGTDGIKRMLVHEMRNAIKENARFSSRKNECGFLHEIEIVICDMSEKEE